MLYLGCRSAAVSLEARSVSGWGTSRHCVIARLEELTIDRFREIRARAGALLIVLPRDLPARPDPEKQVSLPIKTLPYMPSTHKRYTPNSQPPGYNGCARGESLKLLATNPEVQGSILPTCEFSLKQCLWNGVRLKPHDDH
uniref:Uncharacterized protein n=1 Tax=Timema douglasi TaxID=61478 RepID=A0A7R8VFX9_TIMDO|nr:unnamed protein product [Timema douglasi]